MSYSLLKKREKFIYLEKEINNFIFDINIKAIKIKCMYINFNYI